MGPLDTMFHRDCIAMGEYAKISALVTSIFAQIEILSLLIIHIDRSGQIYVTIDYTSLCLWVSCLTCGSYLWNQMGAVDNVSHADNIQSKGCQFFSHLNKIPEAIQVTRVFRYCCDCQGAPLRNESTIRVVRWRVVE
jgi:hypothetical protein